MLMTVSVQHTSKLLGLAAVGATLALVAPTAPPAHANVDPGTSATCAAGDPELADASWRVPIVGTTVTITADCRGSSPSLLARGVDALIGSDTLSSMNQAITFGLRIGTTSTIRGNGLNTAIAALGGDATSSSNLIASIAVSAATGAGTAYANGLLGVGVSLAVGGVGANSATTNALPGGIAIASSNHPLSGRNARATALLGISSATATADPNDGAVCTALYGSAQVTDRSGANIDSCTSVGFLFQRYQEGDGPVWFAVKNPFSVRLIAPIGDGLTGLIDSVGDLVDLPPAVGEVLGSSFVPEFQRDLIRVSFSNGLHFGTDIFGGAGSSDNGSSGSSDNGSTSGSAGSSDEPDPTPTLTRTNASPTKRAPVDPIAALIKQIVPAPR
jgi:hypothetical protein